MELRFSKVEGLGNDFVFIDAREPDHPLANSLDSLREAAPGLCDRRRGIGADGILVALGHDLHDAEMVVINHDGSHAEMCGNGLRCVAAEIAGARETLTIETGAGPLACRILDPGLPDGGRAAEVEVEMGPARPLGQHRPVAAPSRQFTGVSMGNPHAVHLLCDGDPEPEELARALGPDIERDPNYPERTNVEFARVHRRDEAGADCPPWIDLWVWERGCGITEACGTGACATAAAAAWVNAIEREQAVRVRLPGGGLWVTVPAQDSASIRMLGPARRVFRGVLRLEL